MNPNPLTRNFAICSRVTRLVGQYISGEALHPVTTAALYTPSMKEQNGLEELTSVKIFEHAAVVHEPGFAASIPWQMNFAIAWRSVFNDGQYIRGEAWQPLTTPAL
ncbi:MAG: hypothetical protein A2Y62_12665 [Candidatus Fischerbacteria bacterium RBG_13_37_8]|uniref:Uncharacterized protein n=1 Tax=Candidatus Fischerbacteria bacterium RBG_13_37_8 TaxID=1817863 RepID=A0A1F5VQG7_9BACT|nr:MAG: hypothetical protein A2Y62_12665 [Candidatus Fischerbacteria bacterium RBG_13_37_8]